MKPQRIVPLVGQESVWDYPRPPRLETTDRRLQVIVAGHTVADTTRAHRVLETSHPPVYYIPMMDIDAACLQSITATTGCEWKGTAHYFNVVVGNVVRKKAAWSYPHPAADMEPIRGAIAFYPALMDECRVDGQLVTPQPGNFYGGWITSDVVGPFKGVPGSMGW